MKWLLLSRTPRKLVSLSFMSELLLILFFFWLSLHLLLPLLLFLTLLLLVYSYSVTHILFLFTSLSAAAPDTVAYTVVNTTTYILQLVLLVILVVFCHTWSILANGKTHIFSYTHFFYLYHLPVTTNTKIFIKKRK